MKKNIYKSITLTLAISLTLCNSSAFCMKTKKVALIRTYQVPSDIVLDMLYPNFKKRIFANNTYSDITIICPGTKITSQTKNIDNKNKKATAKKTPFLGFFKNIFAKKNKKNRREIIVECFGGFNLVGSKKTYFEEVTIRDKETNKVIQEIKNISEKINKKTSTIHNTIELYNWSLDFFPESKIIIKNNNIYMLGIQTIVLFVNCGLPGFTKIKWKIPALECKINIQNNKTYYTKHSIKKIEKKIEKKIIYGTGKLAAKLIKKLIRQFPGYL
ncbi:hypothetical protein ACFLYU_01525 [Candidatus Dependentiae bacterium]